jgi:hypothetical protein
VQNVLPGSLFHRPGTRRLFRIQYLEHKIPVEKNQEWDSIAAQDSRIPEENIF